LISSVMLKYRCGKLWPHLGRKESANWLTQLVDLVANVAGGLFQAEVCKPELITRQDQWRGRVHQDNIDSNLPDEKRFQFRIGDAPAETCRENSQVFIFPGLERFCPSQEPEVFFVRPTVDFFLTVRLLASPASRICSGSREPVR
jgi:hypothetical protein